MSGHSHWSTIQRQKGAADAKRGQTFTKVANQITIAAKTGGSGDPESNPKLRVALEAAKSVNMPKENVQRAVDRGLGKLPGQYLEEVTYEGFGPGKVAFYLEGITDNKMRTLSELRNLFERSGGSLGGSGSVAYMFDKKGEIKVKSKGGNKEEEMLELIDLGVEDVEEYIEENIQEYLIYVEQALLSEMRNKIVQTGYELISAQIVFKPNILQNITNPDEARKVVELVEKLEESDEIQKVYTNLDIPQGLI